MEQPLGPEAALIEALKGELRSRGWYVRYTEWPSGHQVTVHRRRDTSRHLVTEWHETEVDAWRAARRLVEETEAREAAERAAATAH